GRLGTPFRYVESCPSTQRLLGDDDPEGATVVADHQTEGRGRLGRTWDDETGKSILMSVLLRPAAPMPLWPELSLVAGNAVATAIRVETGVDASLRHPNDVVVAGRKLAGVLPEASRGRVVLGIGVNVNQTADELPPETIKPATSLRLELGHELERGPLVAAILHELELGYDRSGARDPSASVPSHVSDCGPGSNGARGGVATTCVPRSTWKTSWSGARVSMNPTVAVPRETDEVKAVRMSSIASGTVAVAVVTPALAVTTTAYWPFGSPGGGTTASVCAPAGFAAVRSAASTCPPGATSVAVTFAAAVRV